MNEECQAETEERACRVCGCTQDRACPGGCYWVEPDLCSVCFAIDAEQGANVLRRGALDMQVCVPEEWPDERVKLFADAANPCGTTGGWAIRRQGDPALAGIPERNPCANQPGFVHITLDA